MHGAFNFEVLAWEALSAMERRAVLQRPTRDSSGLEQSVADIVSRVRQDGDAAVREYTERFDDIRLDVLQVAEEDLARAASRVEPELLAAIDRAAGRIRAFHEAGMPRAVSLETADGLLCETVYRPIDPVGLYVPGGSAPLISTVLMLAVPACLAGCRNIVLCTPPGKAGEIAPEILAAARRCGVTKVYRAGGAQAIAALAFGTASIPACAKIFGPGNAWVTEAKRQVANLPGGAAQDLPAGPSEVLVIADGEADAEAVAWDLLSQAEHGPDSQALLLSESLGLLEAVAGRIGAMAAALPRAPILEESLRNLRLIRVESLAQAVDISNRYAPEHLILNCRGAERLVDDVVAAGSVFLGPWTPESLGDYCSGTNHVLPTFGYARAYSGLAVADFLRRMTVQNAAPEGLAAAGPDAVRLATAEGLDAHRRAVEYRLESLGRRS